MDKLLTLIVPAYNMEEYLPKCLRSLTAATRLERLDVLVVNDGSSDRTGEIAHELAAEHPQSIRVLDKANGNYGSCINAAIPLAQGRFVKVVDADDTLDTQALDAFLDFLASLREPPPDLVLSDFAIVDAEGNETARAVLPFPAGRELSLADYLATDEVVTMHAFAYRTQLLRDCSYRQLEGVSYTDQEWTLLPLAGVRRIVRFPQVLYRYLLGREGQTMAKQAQSWWMRGEVALDLARRFPADSPSAAPLRRRFAMVIAEVYRGCLFDDPPGARAFDLQTFDRQLREISPELAAAVENIPYSRRISYRFIRAWHRRSPGRRLMFAICRWYSTLVHLAMAVAVTVQVCYTISP